MSWEGSSHFSSSFCLLFSRTLFCSSPSLSFPPTTPLTFWFITHLHRYTCIVSARASPLSLARASGCRRGRTLMMHSFSLTASLLLASVSFTYGLPADSTVPSINPTHAVLEDEGPPYSNPTNFGKVIECGPSNGQTCKNDNPLGGPCCSAQVGTVSCCSIMPLTVTGLVWETPYTLWERLSEGIRVRPRTNRDRHADFVLGTASERNTELHQRSPRCTRC